MIKKFFLATILSISLALSASTIVLAAPGIGGSVEDQLSQTRVDSKKKVGVAELLKTATTTLSSLVGIAAVIMLIFGGAQYVLAGEKDEKVKQAKTTIKYALLGLILSGLAYTLIQATLSLVN